MRENSNRNRIFRELGEKDFGINRESRNLKVIELFFETYFQKHILSWKEIEWWNLPEFQL